mgnify:CR=1 FL=1|tara:strand:+ start:5100 stop:5723 length:624 start_codon:yes stop_codon:yes gene_type:complete
MNEKGKIKVKSNVATYIRGVFNPLTTFMLGLLGGAVLVYLFFVAPQQEHLEMRAESLREWERLIQIERENVADIKKLDTGALKSWIAEREQANIEFEKIRRYLHEQEIRLNSSPTEYLALAVLMLFGLLVYLYFVSKQGNTEDAGCWKHVTTMMPIVAEELTLRIERQTAELQSLTTTLLAEPVAQNNDSESPEEDEFIIDEDDLKY